MVNYVLDAGLGYDLHGIVQLVSPINYIYIPLVAIQYHQPIELLPSPVVSAHTSLRQGT